MSNYHLFYAISKRTPPSPKAMKAIADVQTEVNRRFSWSNERLSLAPVSAAARTPFAFPLVQFAPMRQPSGPFQGPEVELPRTRIENAAASGATKVRGDLWNAHLVVAFLRHVSIAHPELLLELRDEGGFVAPGAVWIKGGKVELQREWLNRERERVLEMTGDPQAAAPFVWAEAEALQGRFFLDTAASDYVEVPEIRELGTSWEDLQSMSLGEVAEAALARVTSAPVPVRG